MLINLDFKRLLKTESKDASIYILVTFITGLGSFLVVPFFWSKLTPADFGIIAITEIAGGFVSIFIGLSLDSSLTRYFYDWTEDERPYKIFTLWIFNWVFSISLTVIILILLYFISDYLDLSIPVFPFIFYGIIQSLLTSFGNLPYAALRIMKKPVPYSKNRIIVFTLTVVLQLYFILYLNHGVLGYFYSMIISGLINTILLITIMIKISKPKFCVEILPEQLSYAIPLIPSNLLSYFSVYLDRILLQQYTTLTTLGIYSVSMKFASLISQLHGALKLSYVPFLFQTMKQNTEEGKSMIEKMKEVYVFVLFFVGLCICLLTKEYVYLTNQPNYLPIIPVVPYLVLIAIVSSLYLYFAPGILLSKRTSFLIYPNLLQIVAFAVIGFFTINSFQVYGIIFSKFISSAVFLIASVMLSNYLYSWTNQYRPLLIYFLFFLIASFLQISFVDGSFIFRVLIDIVLLLGFLIIFILHSGVFENGIFSKKKKIL